MTLLERYRRAIDKCYVQSLNDPETEPYKSKYEARKLFEELYNLDIPPIASDLVKDFDLIHENDSFKFVFAESSNSTIEIKHRYLIRCLLDYHIATIYNDTEERNEGESRLNSLLQSIQSVLPHPILSSLGLNIYNQLILIRTSYDDYQQAIEYARQAEQLYNQSIQFDCYLLQEIIEIDSTISTNERREEFEQIYTHTLFYLAQIYGKLNDKNQSATYCRRTLERQLSFYQNGQTKYFDPLDWSTNCATLSQYYMTNHDYATARYCLQCADLILEQIRTTNDKFLERHASFQRCWIKYAVNLLSDSADRLLQAADRDVSPNEIIVSSSTPKFDFHLSIPTPPITCSFILDYDQARPVFLFAMNIINQAKEFYVLDGFVTDHVEISQDTSQLYLKMVFFESNIDRKCKMHKRRIDILSFLCQQISQEHYLSLIRQLLFELGECYSTLLDLKLEQKTDLNSSKTSEKISHLAQQGVSTFEQFLSTMNDKKTGVKPETYDDDYLRPVLLAYFYLGRFHSKFLTNRIEHLQKTLEHYQYIVAYVDKHPNSKESIEQEYEICKEMIGLLPLKIDKLNKTTN